MTNEHTPVDAKVVDRLPTRGDSGEELMPDSTEDMQGPGGLDLNAQPATGRKISSKIAIIASGLVLCIALLILYGIFSRRHNTEAKNTPSDDKSITAATQNAKEAELVVDSKIEAQRKSALASGNAEDAVTGATTPDGLTAPAGRSTTVKTDLLVPPLGARDLSKAPTRMVGTQGNYDGHQTSMAQSAPMSHNMTAQEKRQEDLYRQEQEAMAAPTGSGSGGSRGGGLAALVAGAGGVGGAGAGKTTADSLTSLISQLRPASVGAASSGAVGGASAEEPNMQDRKDNFIEKARTQPSPNYLAATRVAALGPYEIKAGWDIPTTLEQKINTDLPGEIRALVRENVYDTATGHFLLIPQGSRVLGKYDSHVAYGQSRVQVIWTRLIYPDGSTIDLGGMVGQDARGGAGFHDKVNNHYARMFSMALFTSAFTAGIELSQNSGSSSTTSTPTPSQTATAALGQQMGELGIEIARKNMNIQPTITVPIGYRFNIRVNRDITFAKPYSGRRN